MDLNADLGEGFGRWPLTDDEGLLSVVTSANVACGFHAGDPSTMHRVCDLAAQRGVRIGAQVSYRDLAGFGRRTMDVPARELADEIAYQIGALRVFARSAAQDVVYVKPHGALYNRAVWDEGQAEAVVAGVLTGFGESGSGSVPAVPVLCLPGSALHRAGTAVGLPIVAEAFADRAYKADGTLVPRTEAGAVVHERTAVIQRAVAMAKDGIVTAVSGEKMVVAARSLCLHGDTPGAVDLARGVRSALEAAGVAIEPFA